MSKLFLGFVVVGLIGCVRYEMSVSTTSPTRAKTATCEFRVVNMIPGGNYEEIATLTVSDKAAESPDEFKRAVREDVCRVGGDVVVTEINGLGLYVRGTVLRQQPSPAPVQEAAALQ
jgi:hypothetical protein